MGLKAICLVLVCLALPACSGKTDYIRPSSQPPLSNSILLNKSKDDAWKEIVPALGKNFYVINNIDKSSGLINISYTGDPETYIDCGRGSSYVKNLKGERTYEFPAARANQVYEVMEGGVLYFIDRKVNLEGRMNLIFEELGPLQTKITANTRYVVTRTSTFQQAGTAGTATRSDSIAFNTGQQASFPRSSSQHTVECQANGKFESDVLNLFMGGGTK